MAISAVIVGLTREALERPEAAFEAASLKAGSRGSRGGTVETMELLAKDL
jgi:hypothetical protein